MNQFFLNKIEAIPGEHVAFATVTTLREKKLEKDAESASDQNEERGLKPGKGRRLEFWSADQYEMIRSMIIHVEPAVTVTGWFGRTYQVEVAYYLVASMVPFRVSHWKETWLGASCITTKNATEVTHAMLGLPKPTKSKPATVPPPAEISTEEPEGKHADPLTGNGTSEVLDAAKRSLHEKQAARKSGIPSAAASPGASSKRPESAVAQARSLQHTRTINEHVAGQPLPGRDKDSK